MDFFNKLKQRISLPTVSPKKAQSAQLEKFHSCWTYCHSTYFMQDQKGNRKVHVQLTEIPSYLKTMVDILVQEEIKQEDEQTGACMEYLLKNGVLTVLVNISEADFPLGIRGETIRTISTLVNLLDVKFLIHSAVHHPTLKLLKLCINNENPADKFNNFYIDDLIDLLYTLCSKIHSSPPLLNIFFYDKKWLAKPQKSAHSHLIPQSSSGSTTTRPDQHELKHKNKMYSLGTSDDSSSITVLEGDGNDSIAKEQLELSSETGVVPKLNSPEQPDYECLLFSYLLKFIHREGKSGDYARTGLLFLLEITSGNFRDYVLSHSDLCQILSAGLGALYSQLPRKLLVKGADAEAHRLKGGSNLVTKALELESEDDMDDFEVTSSQAFKTLIDSFLKTLEFCQDVLQRCPSRAVCMQLLSDIKQVFLEAILYPSMLESSDTDGSAVAVISYIDIILQTLKDGELLDLFIRYLVSSDDDDHFLSGGHHVPGRHDDVKELSDTSSIKSADSSNHGITNTSVSGSVGGRHSYLKHSDFLAFNLKDLLFNNLQSKSTPTVIAALKLLNTIVTQHPQYCLSLLALENHFPVALPPTSAVMSPSSSTFSPERMLSPAPFDQPQYVTISSHYQEMQSYFLLINNLDPRFNADGWIPGYEPYLRSVEMIYNSYRSLTHLRQEQAKSKTHARKHTLARNATTGNLNIPTATGSDVLVQDFGRQMELPRPEQQHRLKRDDPLLSILLELLSKFFSNPCELNLVLTGTLSGLAGCPFISLDEWVSFKTAFLPNPETTAASVLPSEDAIASLSTGLSEQLSSSPVTITINPLRDEPPELSEDSEKHYSDDSDDELEPLRDATLFSHRSLLSTKGLNNSEQQPCLPPPIFDILNLLAQEVSTRRRTTSGLDVWLEERRKQVQLSSSNRSGAACIGGTTPKPSSVSSVNPSQASLSSNQSTPSQSLFRRTLTLNSGPSTAAPSANATPQPAQARRKFSFLEALNIQTANALTDAQNSLGISSPKAETPKTPKTATLPDTTSDSSTTNKGSLGLGLNLNADSRHQRSKSDIGNKRTTVDPTFNLNMDLNHPSNLNSRAFCDNILILEESIKELIATLHVRRGYGLDDVLFV